MKNQFLCTGLLLSIVTVVGGCGGGGNDDSGQIDRPASLTGIYDIRYTLSVDTCGGASPTPSSLLILVQNGTSISGTNGGVTRYAGVVSQNPYGFVVENLEYQDEQISVVYSDSERKFKSTLVADTNINGKLCHYEYQGTVTYKL
jgi:hypothetical protein